MRPADPKILSFSGFGTAAAAAAAFTFPDLSLVIFFLILWFKLGSTYYPGFPGFYAAAAVSMFF